METQLKTAWRKRVSVETKLLSNAFDNSEISPHLPTVSQILSGILPEFEKALEDSFLSDTDDETREVCTRMNSKMAAKYVEIKGKNLNDFKRYSVHLVEYEWFILLFVFQNIRSVKSAFREPFILAIEKIYDDNTNLVRQYEYIVFDGNMSSINAIFKKDVEPRINDIWVVSPIADLVSFAGFRSVGNLFSSSIY